MFFSDLKRFEKNSFVLGSFENEIRYNELKLHENKLEILPFLNFCDHDLKWYNQMIKFVSEKEHKLRNPDIQPDSKRRKSTTRLVSKYESKRQLVQYESDNLYESTEEKPSTSSAKNEQIQDVSNFEYSPTSPIEEPSQIETEQPKAQNTEKINKPNLDKELSLKQKESIQTEIQKTPVKPKTVPNKPLDTSKEIQTKQNKSPTVEVNPGKQAYDRWVSNLMKYWYPLRFKLNYPKKSLLNGYEQKEFLEYHLKFRNRSKVAQSEVKLFKKYLYYRQQVEKERVEFVNYLKDYYRHAEEDYEFMNHSIERYVNEMLSYLNSLTINFERFYLKCYELSLAQLDLNNNQKVLFHFERNLVQLGHVQKVVIPSITIENQPPVILDYGRLSSRAPVSKGSKKKSKIPLFEDKNAEKLALKYKCNIVMTNSAFVNLIYNLTIPNTDELRLPFVVKEITTQDGQNQKVVFIEKPLIPKHLSKREINEKFYKRALMVTLVKQQANVGRFKRPNITPTPRASADKTPKPVKPAEMESSHRLLEKLNVDYNLVNELETFGVSDKIKTNILVEQSDPAAPVEKQNKNEKEPEKSPIDITNENIKDSKLEEPKKAKKRSRNSIDSDNSLVNSKKIKSANSSDYEEYISNDDSDRESYDEDENENLLIIESKEDNQETKSQEIKEPEKKIEIPIPEMPESPEPQKEEDSAPKSPTLENIDDQFGFIQPKVIPLTKPSSSENVKEKDSPISSHPKPEDAKKVPIEEKLSLFDLISKLQDKLVETPKTPSNQPTQSTVHTVKAMQTPVENAREFDYLENMHDNLSYTLWTLSGNNPIKILVRSSTDGYINTEHSSQNSVVLYSKLEYQPQFGCERLSTKDHCRMWAKSYLRNCCDVFLCRINVFTNRLISVSKLAHEEILPKDAEFNPHQGLNHLKNFLENIFRFETSSYLATKEPNEQRINLLRSSSANKTGSFDLHFYYQGYSVEEVRKPSYWMPIDPDLYLPYHHKLNRPPCLFEPAHKEGKTRAKGEATQNKQSNQKKSKRKSRKNKGKGTKNAELKEKA